MRKDKAEKIQRKSLKWFADRMLDKLMERLSRNDGEPLLGVQKDHNVYFYYKRMIVETRELQKALSKHDIYDSTISKQAVIRECADVANFVAAIAEMMREDEDE
jgi:hypothetical protein